MNLLMPLTSKYFASKISLKNRISKVLQVLLVQIFLVLLTYNVVWSRPTVYVFPPNFIGEEDWKLEMAEEVLRKEINLYFDLAHNPSYEKLVVDFMKGNSDGILNQFFYGECKEDCLLSQRILLEDSLA